MTMTAVPEKERLAILRTLRGKSVAELQAEVDSLISKIVNDTTGPDDRRRAAVLATVILDRTPSRPHQE